MNWVEDITVHNFRPWSSRNMFIDGSIIPQDRVTGQDNLESSETMGSAPVLGDRTNTHSRAQMLVEEKKKERECRLQITVTDMLWSILSANYYG